MPHIDPKLVSIAINECDRDAFEKYSQTVFGETVGPQFRPLGGMHNGGADGFVEGNDILEENSKPTRFFQASMQVTVAAKIRTTVKRLRNFGRHVLTLYFATSQVVQTSDKLEHDLGEELGITLRIYDRLFFEQHANDSIAVQAAFDHHLRSATAFLDNVVAPSFPKNSFMPNAQAVCAFLGQELERRVGTVKTLEAVCDSLILWALEGTDPDKGLFLTQDKIVEKVLGVIPSTKQFFRGQVDNRLRLLVEKKGGTRTVNFHPNENGYCLPYATREAIHETTVADEKLKGDVSASLPRSDHESRCC